MAGTLTIDTLQDGSSNSSSVTDVVKGSARAWVNFNGTGTVAIRSAYNVSSITDNATGQYIVNFTNQLTSTNYAVTLGLAHSPYNGLLATNGGSGFSPSNTTSSTRIRVVAAGSSATYYDADYLNLAVYE